MHIVSISFPMFRFTSPYRPRIKWLGVVIYIFNHIFLIWADDFWSNSKYKIQFPVIRFLAQFVSLSRNMLVNMWSIPHILAVDISNGKVCFSIHKSGQADEIITAGWSRYWVHLLRYWKICVTFWQLSLTGWTYLIRGHGVRKGLSTGRAINEFIINMYEGLDGGNKTFDIFLDLRKAFDLVDRKILLCKFQM